MTTFYETERFLSLYEPLVLEHYRKSGSWPVTCDFAECKKPAVFTDPEEGICLCLECLRKDERANKPLELAHDELAALDAIEKDELLRERYVLGAFWPVTVAYVVIDAVNGDEVEIIARRDVSGWTYEVDSSGTEFSVDPDRSDEIADAQMVIEMVEGLDAGGDNLFDVENWGDGEAEDDDETGATVSVSSPLYPEVAKHFESR